MLDCSLPVIMGKEQSEHSQTLLVVLCQIPAAPAWAAVIVNLLVPGEPCPFSTSLQYLQMCWKSSWHKQSRLLSALAEVCVFGFSLFSVVVSSFPAGKIVIQQGNGNTGQEIRDQEVFNISLHKETRMQTSEDQEQLIPACTKKELGFPC